MMFQESQSSTFCSQVVWGLHVGRQQFPSGGSLVSAKTTYKRASNIVIYVLQGGTKDSVTLLCG